ncbi:telomere repeats-binding bouquet formation protein 1 isoform X6 [Gouania willdenowi]|uniref:telomere repeats-binding bouquet formation protein 1 isoform X6 n=1 Tax=Gouania willdenowi TaxID=441366 RepID=UPI001056A47A|nr:telomere repeats-binding bouquet formation protein 1 isoform X6 [Gouania willdenowi]
MRRMDKTEIRRNSRNTTKTDLCMLLECLKFQMKSPELQKQALLTINSICENREDNVDLLREMGGVVFLFNLSKSTVVHSEVKETALFTLGTLAEANVYCKNSLCRKETFASLADWILKDNIPLTQKRVSVYLLFVLVANNKSGQTLAQTTGCLDILLDLFRSSFPLSSDSISTAPNATATYQLWTSVSSALCGCVNNPQNEEGQRICVVVFPILKTWLQQIELPHTEMLQAICSFIAMTVSNNSFVQESFSVCGALKTLTLTLVRVASCAHTSLLSYQLSVILSKTLSACITDKPTLASGLAQYNVVFHLLSLLASPHLDPEDRLSVLLSLGHFTEASEEHQAQLVQCGGLPLVITLLTEDTDEEIKKATTFILQTCKQATMCFGECSVKENNCVEPPTNLEIFKTSARELLHKMNLLEELKNQDVSNEEEKDVNQPTSTQRHHQTFHPSALQQKEFKKPFLMNNRLRAGRIPAERQSLPNIRCAGCIFPFEKITSRTFTSLQSSCQHSCDMHRILGEATERFRTRHSRLLTEHSFQNAGRALNLTPLRGRPTADTGSIGLGRHTCVSVLYILPISNHIPPFIGRSLTPLKRPCHLGDPCVKSDLERRKKVNSGHSDLSQSKRGVTSSPRRRRRKDFTHAEVQYLLSGVKTYGFSWNNILWMFPFQPGRTSVDLAKKYRRLMLERKTK